MPVDPYPGVPSPNTLADAAKMRSQLDALFLAVQPSARVYQGIDHVIPNNTASVLSFTSERFDNDAIHDTASNSQRLTCKTKGLYAIGASIVWASNASGHREVGIRVNGAGESIVASTGRGDSALATKHSLSTIWQMNVNDYVEVLVFQNSGGNLNVQFIDRQSPEFWMCWVGYF